MQELKFGELNKKLAAGFTPRYICKSNKYNMIASHIIFGCYGFWLPNDPRGAWSDYIRNKKLLAFGKANKVYTVKSVADIPHDRDYRFESKYALKYKPVKFNGLQAKTVGDGFATAVNDSDYNIAACAIMPDHVHLIVGEHENETRRIIGHFKARATRELNSQKLNPFFNYPNSPSPWAKNGWTVCIDTDKQLFEAIEYVNNNPIKSGLPRQKWSFVKPVQKG